MGKPSLQSTLEKTARVIGNNYGVRVEFEGDEACTDGNLIRLPVLGQISEENEKDLDGYLAHEVGHIKFTDFESWFRINHSFHRVVANLAEDVRIESLMGSMFAGAKRHLCRLRDKIEIEQDRKWPALDPLFRFGGAMQRILQQKSYPRDPEIVPWLRICKSEIFKLKTASSTEEVRNLTWVIVEKLKRLFESQIPPNLEENEAFDEFRQEKSGGEGKNEFGRGKPENQTGGNEEGQDQSLKEGPQGDSEAVGNQANGGCEEGRSLQGGNEVLITNEGGAEKTCGGNYEGNSPGSRETIEGGDSGEEKSALPKGDWDDVRRQAQKIMNGGPEADWAEELFGGDIGKVLRDAIQEWVSKERKSFQGKPDSEDVARKAISDGMTLSIPFLAASRRFDREINLSGDGTRYAVLKAQTRRARVKLRIELDRALFANQNADWITERDEGEIDAQLLSGVRFGQSRIFRELRQGKTKQVAISILVDCSSSMTEAMGEQKKALCAMAESLKQMSIPFEVTGFRSMPDPNLEKFSQGLKYRNRFNRTGLRIEYEIAKEFHSGKLEGIEALQANGTTPLNEAVAWAGSRLDRQPGTRKILMVFTDGEPYGCGDARVLRNDLILQIHRLERVGIEVIGFAIKCPTVERFFPRSISIGDARELEGKALAEMRNLLLPETLEGQRRGRRKKKGDRTPVN